MHQDKAIAVASIQLKVHDKNYSTHVLDIEIVVFAINIWRHYLHGVHIDMFRNRKSLHYVLTHKDFNLRKMR